MCLNPHWGLKIGKEIKMITETRKLEIIQTFKDWNRIITYINCGKCKECKHEKQIELIQRMKIEARNWKENIICTLTYNDKNKKNLNVKDMQDFIKRLRNKLNKEEPEKKIKYFYCGEKGEKTKREHYHCIIFNYKPKDEIFYKESKKGNKQYISAELNKLWGMGQVTHGNLNNGAIGYVTKYLTKNKDAIFKWSKNPTIGIPNKKTAEELEKEYKNKIYIPKYIRQYILTKTGRKIKKTKEQEERLNLIFEEKQKQLEEQTKMLKKDYVLKRAKLLYKR